MCFDHVPEVSASLQWQWLPVLCLRRSRSSRIRWRLVSSWAATDGVTPIFPEKTDNLFSHHRLSVLQCHPYFVPKMTTFFAHHCHFSHFTRVSVSPPELKGVTPDLCACPTSFVHCSLKIQPQFFSFGCHSLEGVTRGGPPYDATVRWFYDSSNLFAANVCSMSYLIGVRFVSVVCLRVRDPLPYRLQCN